MSTHLHKKFKNSLKQLFNCKTQNRILVAASGGQDSLCLIKLLSDLKIDQLGLCTIEIIHIDHQWRQDCEINVKHLINIVKSLNLRISIYQVHKSIKSEQEARYLRYQILFNHAQNHQYSIVMTAHTETDRIETFIQQLIRGTSIDGGTSLTYGRQINNTLKLMRPLLNFKREEIRWFCNKFFLPIWSDITNYEYAITRNRIRYELIPYLKQYFLITTNTKIVSFLNISNLDNEYLKQNAIKLYLETKDKKLIGLNHIELSKQHTAIQMRTLQLFFHHNFGKTIDNNINKQIIYLINGNYNLPQTIKWHVLYIRIYHIWLYIYSNHI